MARNPRRIFEREGWWYYVRRVPGHLTPRFGTIIKRSLKTQDEALALQKARSLDVVYNDAFESNRVIEPQEIKNIARGVYQQASTADIPESQIDDMLLVLHEQLEHGTDPVYEGPDTSVTLPDGLERNLSKQGVILNDDTRLVLSRHILQAEIKALNDLRSYRKGEFNHAPIPSVEPSVGPVAPPPIENGLVLTDAIDLYLERPEKTKIKQRVYNTQKRHLELYRDHIGTNTPLPRITRIDFNTWIIRISKLNPSWARTRKNDGKTLAQIEAWSKQEAHEGLSASTVGNYTVTVNTFWQWLQDKEHFIGTKPAYTLTPKKAPGREPKEPEPYTDDEVIRLFGSLVFEIAPENHTTLTALPWLTLLGAYSGARIEELCSIRVDDLGEDKDTGIWYMDIRKSKTDAGRRRVPIHSKIIEAGLMDYADNHGDQFLIPALNANQYGDRSTTIGKAYGKYRKSLGIEDKTFHSWRNTAITKLHTAGVSLHDANTLVGHESHDITYSRYSGGLALENQREQLEKIDYTSLTINRKAPC